jgi:hypothetical protein
MKVVKVRERIQELWSSDLNVKNRSVNRSPDWRWKKNKKMTEGRKVEMLNWLKPWSRQNSRPVMIMLSHQWEEPRNFCQEMRPHKIL